MGGEGWFCKYTLLRLKTGFWNIVESLFIKRVILTFMDGGLGLARLVWIMELADFGGLLAYFFFDLIFCKRGVLESKSSF